MAISSKQYEIIILSTISFILVVSIFNFVDYLTNNNYIIEGFDNSINHTVNMPLNNTDSCQNLCGPNSRCSVTGQQCLSDIDCPGCQSIDSSQNTVTIQSDVPGNNDSGKLSFGVSNTYSPLTNGYGTHQKIITKNMYSKPDAANFGENTWSNAYEADKKMFDKRYKPSNVQDMPDYPERYSLSGQFVEDGPFPSNAELS